MVDNRATSGLSQSIRRRLPANGPHATRIYITSIKHVGLNWSESPRAPHSRSSSILNSTLSSLLLSSLLPKEGTRPLRSLPSLSIGKVPPSLVEIQTPSTLACPRSTGFSSCIDSRRGLIVVISRHSLSAPPASWKEENCWPLALIACKRVLEWRNLPFSSTTPFRR